MTIFDHLSKLAYCEPTKDKSA